MYCYPDCRSCDPTNRTVCYVCAANYFKSGTGCVSICPAKTYANPLTLACSACDPACATCQNATNCTSCPPNTFQLNAFCFANCSSINSSYYSYSGRCLTCQCKTCIAGQNSPFACATCSDPSYYYNPATFACTINCTGTYYAKHATRHCLPCAAPCATCDKVYDSCLSCQGQLLAYKGGCLPECPLGYYQLSGTCSQCGANCYLCNA